VADDRLIRFLRLKRQGLKARAQRLVKLDPEAVGLRAQDLRYAPSPSHFRAAQRRLSRIDRLIRTRLGVLDKLMARKNAPSEDILLSMAMVEREIDRARRTFGMFFEIFAQRGTAFAPALAAHDAIAVDCYAAVRTGLPGIFSGPVLKPIAYLEHGYSPATMRRGVSIARLLGEPNPFPLIRIPWDRDQPWQAVFLHEVAHNLMADLRVWNETRDAVIRRLAEVRMPLRVTAIYGRWHKEIFADVAAILLGGPASAFSMAEFLAHPADRVLTYRPGGAHPTGLLRAGLMAEMLRRLGFGRHAETLQAIWRQLYGASQGHRIPDVLLETREAATSAVIDEIGFQPRRNLAERALASIIKFTPLDQRAIRRGGYELANGRPAIGLPPRHVVGACRYALEDGADPTQLAALVIRHLSQGGSGWSREPLGRQIERLPIAPAQPPAGWPVLTAA
jgi:hypothetical protein